MLEIQGASDLPRLRNSEYPFALVRLLGGLLALLQLRRPLTDPLFQTIVLHQKFVGHLVECVSEVRELIVHEMFSLLDFLRYAKLTTDVVKPR